MTAWRVLGVGSPFGDDQLGWRLVAAFESLGDETGLDCMALALDRPGAGLIHALTGARGAILVDALQGMGNPGRIHCLAAADLLQSGGCFSSHGFGVAEALGLAAELDLLPQHFRVLGVEMSEGRSTDDISPAVAAAVPELCALITVTLGAWRSEQPGLNDEVKPCA